MFVLTFKIYGCVFTSQYTVLGPTSLKPFYSACIMWLTDWFAITLELTVFVFYTDDNIGRMCHFKWIKYWKEKHSFEYTQYVWASQIKSCQSVWSHDVGVKMIVPHYLLYSNIYQSIFVMIITTQWLFPMESYPSSSPLVGSLDPKVLKHN